jgi:hypothetical protein
VRQSPYLPGAVFCITSIASDGHDEAAAMGIHDILLSAVLLLAVVPQ